MNNIIKMNKINNINNDINSNKSDNNIINMNKINNEKMDSNDINIIKFLSTITPQNKEEEFSIIRKKKVDTPEGEKILKVKYTSSFVKSDNSDD